MMNSRQLARAAGISHQTCAVVIKNLERFRLVNLASMGNCSVATLNESNAIVSELLLPLFDKERAMVSDVEGTIRRRLGNSCQRIFMRQAASGVGEVDLITAEVDQMKAVAAELSAGFEERYGFDIRFNVYSYRDAPLSLVTG